MRIGTTPTHSFVLPFPANVVEQCEIIYQQNDKDVLKKYITDCEIEGNTISCTLTQAETFEFDESCNVYIQLRVLTGGGDALASDIICVRCDKCLSDEVL